jgi:nanoRNase/pAp phosphatase (c-di-AMP/oligoRNAs hydrolase)
MSKPSLSKLKKVISKCRNLAIVVCDYPSPDEVVSGVAFQKIVNSLGCEAGVLFRGKVKDDSFLSLLPEQPKVISSAVDLEGNEIALIGVYPREVKYISRNPEIIISIKKEVEGVMNAKYVDIRDGFSANSSLIWEYLKKLKIDVDERLATILSYALRMKTKKLLHATIGELQMWEELYPAIDREVLLKLELNPPDLETLKYLSNAISRMVLKKNHLITTIGVTQEFSYLPKVCRYLLELENILSVLVFSVSREKIQMYAEAKREVNVLGKLKKGFSKWGKVEGTDSFAMAEIPIGVFGTIVWDEQQEYRDTLLDSIAEIISSKYLE